MLAHHPVLYFTNSSTKGALGFVGGIAAADGNTGIARIGADLKAVNCNFLID